MGLAILKGLFGSEDVYGSKPKPVATPRSEDILREASLANIANLDNANKLASTENEFNLDEALKYFERVAPGVFPKLIENITAGARGEISGDTSDELFRQGAARGIDSGTSGSEFNRYLTARDVGRTSLSEQQRAQNNFQSLMKGALPNLFDPNTQLFRPQDVQAQENLGFSNDVYNAKIKAAADPGEAGAAAAQTAFMESLQGSYTGNTNFSNQYQNPFTTTSSPSTRGASEGGGNIGDFSGQTYDGSWEAFDQFGNWNF